MAMQVTFLGGTETVTDSKYLLESQNHRLLVGCGPSQEVKALRWHNWQALDLDLMRLDAWS